MLFNPKYTDDIKKADLYYEKLKNGDSPFEMTKKNKKRTLKQNAYLHKLFTLFGIEYGNSVNEAKKDIKEALGYMYVKNGKEYYCETSKMDTKELSIFIDKFRKFALDQGCYLPTADEYNGRFEHYENEIERHERYL